MRAEQINVEYFFRLLYELIYETHASFDYEAFRALLAYIWLWVVWIGYGLSVIGLFIIIYTMMRVFDLRKREDQFYGTLLITPEAAGGINPRWGHIQSLMEGTTPSQWREAIVEADIMLEDMLTKQGYTGESI